MKQPLRVLVVDDEKISRVTTVQQLEDAGYVAAAAESGPVALEAFGTRQDLLGDEQRRTVRGIVRNRLSPLAPVTRWWMERLAAKHSASPLWAAMRDELEAYRKRDAERRSRYLFEKAP